MMRHPSGFMTVWGWNGLRGWLVGNAGGVVSILLWSIQYLVCIRDKNVPYLGGADVFVF